MRQRIGKIRIGRIVGLIAIVLAVSAGTALIATDAGAQGKGCVSSAGIVTQPDHLKCYRIADPFINTDVLSLDSPQFGIEPGCQVKGHASNSACRCAKQSWARFRHRPGQDLRRRHL
jgi:hypothetical protein